MTHPIVLQTERLTLRLPVHQDAGRIQTLAGDAKISRVTTNIPYPYPDAAAEKFIADVTEGMKNATGYTFAVYSQLDDMLVGMIGLGMKKEHSRAEMGYWIGVDFWGKGYATEVAKEIIRFGFEDLNLNKIYACYFSFNPASGRVQEKAGMQQEGVFREHILKDGRYIDLVYTSILRNQYCAT